MTERLSSSNDVAPAREGASVAVFKDWSVLDWSVLLVRRGRAPFAELWSLPGGKTEGEETPRETARRELKEETGIEADVEGIVDIVTIAAVEGNGGPVTYRLTVFYGRYAGGNLAAGGDTEAAEWVHLDEIEALPMTEGTAELIWLAAHRLRKP
jgi:8-oxo-dGTP diphosphatase